MVEIELHSDGIIELLQSAELMAECEAHAERVAASAGDGFEVGTAIAHARARAFVEATTAEARKACYSDNVLLKALGE